MENLVAKSQIVINVPAAKVWDALTNPEVIKQYLFGTNAESDWKVGSSITYVGVWQGKEYKDKGVILEFIPNKKLVNTYWSGFSGKPDMPENYMKITNELLEENGKTTLTITQENNQTEEGREHSESNWNSVLTKIKEILEK